MATQDLARVLNNPGRLIVAPTSTGIGSSYPYGGTPLGVVKRARLRWGIRYENVVAEEWGEAIETIRTGERPLLAFLLEQWDDDAIRKFFPRVTLTPSPAGLTDMVRIDGAAGPGYVAAIDPILFAPFDPSHKAIFFRRPIARLLDDAETAFAVDETAAFPFVFEAQRDQAWSSVPPWQVDRLEHLQFS
jgi:hypothetical protein